MLWEKKTLSFNEKLEIKNRKVTKWNNKKSKNNKNGKM